VYLGFLMTPTKDVSLEIQRRIQTANRCFFGLRKHLQSSHLSRQTKFTIYKTLIRLVLLYGSEMWVLTKREENQLLVFERKVLRTICGPKIDNDVYTRRYKRAKPNGRRYSRKTEKIMNSRAILKKNRHLRLISHSDLFLFF
jgi:hypothetical protein